MFRHNRHDFSVDKQTVPFWAKGLVVLSIAVMGVGIWHYHKAQQEQRSGVAPVYAPSQVAPMQRLMVEQAREGTPAGVRERRASNMSPTLDAAMKGDVEAMMQTGHWHFRRGANYKTAFMWFRRAALAGHREGCLWVGYMYQHGLGKDKSPERALGWYTLAREIGASATGDLRQGMTTALAANDDIRRKAELVASTYRDRIKSNALSLYGRLP